MKLFPHQQKFLDKNPHKALLNWECRVGKSFPAALWIDNPCRTGNTFIICLKQNKKDWEAFNTKATVLTKEEFKKVSHSISNPTAVVVDEIHNFGSPLFLRKGGRKRSQLAEALYNLCIENPNMDLLGLSATMVKNDAWSLHTLLCYIGEYYDWKAWREEFFELKAMPFLPRQPWMRSGQVPEAWAPRHDWRERLKPYLVKHTDIVSLVDIVESLPPATTEIIKVKTPPYKPPENEIVSWMNAHEWEQQGKADVILGLGYKKLLISVNYTTQIDMLARELSGNKPVFVLDGRTKDPQKVKQEAQDSDECYFICQSSMLVGFDGWQFGAIVFASLSHSNVHHIQALGRQRHVKHLRPVVNYYLQGGIWDKRIMDCVFAGRDFNSSMYE